MSALGPRFGGNSTALAVGTPTLITAIPGSLWSANVTAYQGDDGGFYDAASIADASPANLLVSVTGMGPIGLTSPMKFSNGLVFLAGLGMVANVAYSTGP